MRRAHRSPAAGRMVRSAARCNVKWTTTVGMECSDGPSPRSRPYRDTAVDTERVMNRRRHRGTVDGEETKRWTRGVRVRAMIRGVPGCKVVQLEGRLRDEDSVNLVALEVVVRPLSPRGRLSVTVGVPMGDFGRVRVPG